MQYYRILSLATRKPLTDEEIEADALPAVLPALTEEYGPVILDPVAPDWWERGD